MVFLLLGAGSETTTHLISGSVYELLKDPGLRDWLAADWSRASLAVEEFLRFVSPVQFSKPRYRATRRRARRRQPEEGRPDHGDDRRPPTWTRRRTSIPERLDLERRPNRHISFGTGIHFCLGHQLGTHRRRCARCRRCSRAGPGFELAVEPSQIRWRRRPGIRMIAELPVADGFLTGAEAEGRRREKLAGVLDTYRLCAWRRTEKFDSIF